MTTWPRRVRGAIGMGLVWAVTWALFGLAIGVASLLTPGLPWNVVFDVFDGLQSESPEPGSTGAELSDHFGNICGQLEGVRQLLAPYGNVHFHPGIFPDSAASLGEECYSFVHLDLDLRSSTSAALRYFHPRMLPGGILIGDDYDDAVVRDVFTEFFADKPDTLIEWPWGQVMVVRSA